MPKQRNVDSGISLIIFSTAVAMFLSPYRKCMNVS
jgi:hypothetical protein